MNIHNPLCFGAEKRYWLLVLPAFSSIFTEIDAPSEVPWDLEPVNAPSKAHF
jgi:hypothetical protein